MNFKKTFTSKQSISILIFIILVGIVGVVYTQREVSKINQKTIEQEIEIQKNIGKLLLELRANLKSDKPNDIKIRDSFKIIGDIRTLIDREYFSLKKESKRGADLLKNRLSEIEKAILEDPNKAIILIDKLIDELENSNGLSDFIEKKEDGTKNNFDDSNYDFGDTIEPKNNLNNDRPNDEGVIVDDGNNTIPDDNQDFFDSIFNYLNYKKGIKPKVDRDNSKEIEGQTVPVSTKIGN